MIIICICDIKCTLLFINVHVTLIIVYNINCITILTTLFIHFPLVIESISPHVIYEPNMLHNISLLHMYEEVLGMTIFENYYKVHKKLAKNTYGLYPLLVRNA